MNEFDERQCKRREYEREQEDLQLQGYLEMTVKSEQYNFGYQR